MPANLSWNNLSELCAPGDSRRCFAPFHNVRLSVLAPPNPRFFAHSLTVDDVILYPLLAQASQSGSPTMGHGPTCV
jgi:hypothetical protein